MAYSNGNAVLVANPTPAAITVGATTVQPGKSALCTPTDAVAITLTAALTKGTPVTSLAVSALAQAVQAGTVIDISQTDSSGVVHKDQVVVNTSAAAAATSLTINSYTPSFSFTTAATLLSSSQGQVAGAVELGACVLTSFVSSADVIDAAVQLMEKGSRMAYGMARAVMSAGSDTFGVKGL